MSEVEHTGQLRQELNYLFSYGLSERLRQHLQPLEHATTQSGSRKYSRDSMLRLKSTVISRNFKNPLWELSHLLVAVEVCVPHPRSPTLQFFYGQELSRESVKASFASPVNNGYVNVELQGSLIQLRYASGDAFDVHVGRVNFLAALLDFMLSWLRLPLGAWPLLDDLLKQPDFKAVQTFSNQNKSILVTSLVDEVRTDGEYQRGLGILRWLYNKAPAHDRSRPFDVVSDQSLLDFWIAHASDPDSGFVTFESVVDNFNTLFRVQHEGKRDWYFENPLALGVDEGADVDLERLDATDIAGEWHDPDDAVADAWHFIAQLSKTKTVNIASEANLNMLRGVCLYSEVRSRLPLTLARLTRFGAYQKIVRRYKGKPDVAGKISCDEVDAYASLQADFWGVLDSLEKIKLCILQLLWEHGDMAVMPHFMNALPADARQLLVEKLSSDSAREYAVGQFLDNPAALALQIPAVKEQLRNMQRLFNRTKRQGITDVPANAELQMYPEILDAIATVFVNVSSFYADFTDHVEQTGGLQTTFDSDRQIYAGVFSDLYGESEDES